MVTASDKAFIEKNGYAVVEGLFAPEEVAFYRGHFMALRAEGVKPGDMVAETSVSVDPLKKFPRMIHMHRWDEDSLRWLLRQLACASA